jgi:uncharacterized repeat protein (TIGR03847 family)
MNEVARLSAVTMGVPGKRTFFLILGQPGEWVRAWLEKELLEALALAIDQFLANLAQEGLEVPDEVAPEDASEEVPAGLPSIELEIDQIALGYDRDMATLVLSIHPSGPQTLDWSELSCRVSLARLKSLGIEAGKICAAGRPRCKLCGGPIDPEGHICPKTN